MFKLMNWLRLNNARCPAFYRYTMCSRAHACVPEMHLKTPVRQHFIFNTIPKSGGNPSFS